MKLKSLTVTNFRSIKGTWHIPLDSQVVLIHGPNGAGKTSLLSALELASTGDVAYLKEQGGNLPQVLLHEGNSHGQVKLTIESPDKGRVSGDFTLDPTRILGKPALSAEERIHFLERCFLPQTALGRLLETYTATGKQVDTALIRFVKSIIGLEDLDNLIEGLRTSGHINRTKALSSSWKPTEQKAEKLSDQRSELTLRYEEQQRQVASTLQDIRSLSGSDDDVSIERMYEFAANEQNHSRDIDNSISRLESVNSRLSGIRSELQSTRQLIPNDVDSVTDGVVETKAGFEKWESTTGLAIIKRVNEIRNEYFGLAPIASIQLFEEYKSLVASLEVSHRNQIEKNELLKAADNQRRKLLKDVAALDSNIVVVRSRISDLVVTPDEENLTEVLEGAIKLISDNVCPVCDQEQPDKTETLLELVQRKLNLLTNGKTALLQARNELDTLETRLKGVNTQILALPEVEDYLDKPWATLVEEMTGLQSSILEGQKLYQRLQESTVRHQQFASDTARKEITGRSLREIQSELNVPETENDLARDAELLQEIVTQRIQEAAARKKNIKLLTEALSVAQSLSEKASSLRAERDSVQVQLDELDLRLSAAKARKDSANDIRKSAERVRSALINKVFSDSLNSLWSDLFSRFIPTEKFVPQFQKQNKAQTAINVTLETRLPNDEVRGAPAAILSYGNTNTAALSLFLALHLSTPSGLPWLIFDDPVQSMDDIHISNFSAVIRELAYSHNRQIVIAVHQRELFDYLSLELAPTTPSESLCQVVIGREGGATEIDVVSLSHAPEEQLTNEQIA
ncbi:AAA family ATPase [Jonesiaceae bacterium BS-20]|uniref:Nuclease SbcCD subunit C n=1 Tax=Jonesiaceae bacterium BS-20 TaxID=3120821 RepID=A0AAU7DXQ3_9MICO